MLAAVTLIALALSGATAFQNRNGRTAELRVFNFITSHDLSNGDSTVQPLLSDGITEFTNGGVRVNTVFSSDIQETVFNNVQPSFTPEVDSFEVVDIEGVNNNLNVTLVQSGLDTTNHQVCTGQSIQANKRNTIVITSEVDNEDIPNSVCSSIGGTCSIDNNDIVAGEVEFTCDVFTETLNDNNDCVTDPANIFRQDPLTCDQFIFRTSTSGSDLNSGLNEEIRLGDPLTPNTLANPDIIENLDQTQTYVIINTEVFSSAPARRHELFWGPMHFSTGSLKTAFVTLINGNFRTSDNAGTSLENTYDFEIRDSDGNNVHRDFNIQPNSKSPSGASEFIELPLGIDATSAQFTLVLYTDESDNSIFGTKSPAAAPTATIVDSFTFTLTPDEYSVLMLSGGTDANTNDPTFDKVLIQNLSTADVDDDQVGYQLYNFINGNLPLIFATPDSDCCNFVNFNEGDTLNQGATGVTIQTDGLPLSNDNSLNMYTDDASCGSLASSLLQQNAVTLNNDANTCRRRAIFILGRETTLEDIAVSSDVGSCSTTDCSNTQTVVSSVNNINDASSTSVTTIEVEVPQCSCADVTPVVPDCDVCLVDEFAAIDTSLSLIRSSVSSVESTLSGEINDVDNDLRKVGKNVEDVESEIGALDSEFDDLASEIDAVEDEVKANRRINNKILDEVQD